MGGEKIRFLCALAVSMMVLAAPPTSDAGSANRGEGSSGPGVGESAPGEAVGRSAVRCAGTPSEGSKTYIDRLYGFSVKHPDGFVVRPQDPSRLGGFSPTPIVSIHFMNPTMAKGALAGMEPPDLDVRVYRAGAASSLENWLASTGFASKGGGTDVRPYRNANLSGLKVCQTTMIAPGCSYYFLFGGRVYALTPATVEGEAMLESFSPAP